MFPATEAGFCDVFGNVWEWTEDHFNGLENFETHFLYDDFSSPCFDGKHNVMLVSSRAGPWINPRRGVFLWSLHFAYGGGVAQLVEHRPRDPMDSMTRGSKPVRSTRRKKEFF